MIFMMEITKHRMKLSQLRALVAVAEYGNFSEAAVIWSFLSLLLVML
jgi:3-oxoacyl-[acyl-carrier-protein] synthase III